MSVESGWKMRKQFRFILDWLIYFRRPCNLTKGRTIRKSDGGREGGGKAKIKIAQGKQNGKKFMYQKSLKKKIRAETFK